MPPSTGLLPYPSDRFLDFSGEGLLRLFFRSEVPQRVLAPIGIDYYCSRPGGGLQGLVPSALGRSKIVRKPPIHRQIGWRQVSAWSGSSQSSGTTRFTQADVDFRSLPLSERFEA